MNFLVDTRGFNDPLYKPNHKIWTQLDKELQQLNVDFKKDGIRAIVIPIMMDRALRLKEETIQIIFESLVLFNLANN